MSRAIGTVDMYDATGGYGVIKVPNNPDLFRFSDSDVELGTMQVGAHVSFDILDKNTGSGLDRVAKAIRVVASMHRTNGTVNMYDATGGYGVIKVPNNPDLFRFSDSNVEFGNLRVGALVSFEIFDQNTGSGLDRQAKAIHVEG